MTAHAELGFVSGAALESELRLLGVHGREEISRLFEYDLLLARAQPLGDAEIEGLLGSPCAIALGAGSGEVVHGVLTRLATADDEETARYVARMVPTVWLLSLGRSSRIYRDLALTGLLSDVLGRYHLRPMTKGSDGTARSGDFLFSQIAASPKREYIVQYEESDLDFVQRWLEHEGMPYWFEHHAHGDVFVAADGNPPRIAEAHELRHRRRNDLASGGVDTVWGFELEQRRVPARVVVGDYNYRAPAIRLRASAVVDGGVGFGTVFNYGEHFKTVAEGQQIARARAERLACERRVFEGETDCPRLRAGHLFTLAGHPTDRDGEYLVVSVESRVGLPMPMTRGAGATPAHAAGSSDRSAEEPAPYEARFKAIPRASVFRPDRRTPWPTIHGVMHAHVSSEGDGQLAQIDDQGRYRVVLPFAASQKNGGAVSRWIRMAQPYAGAGHGTHAPLRKGAEVLLAYLDGDPDRPIIVGAVPNALAVSPVTAANASRSVTRTASGIRMEMDDQSGGLGS